MKRILELLSYAAILSVIAPTDSQSQSDNRHCLKSIDSTGWEFIPATGANIDSICTAGNDGVFSIKGRPIGYLATRSSFENYRLHVEYRWPEGATEKSNSGVLIHIASGPVDRGTWPECTPHTGRIGFQLEGMPYDLRNIWLERLD